MPKKQIIVETEQERKDREHQEDLQRLRGFRPIDDTFMRGMLRDNIPLANFIVRILLNMPDFEFIKFETQADMKRVTGARSVIFDGLGTQKGAGRKVDVEMQRADIGAEPERARYHSSVIDVESLDEGQDFTELPDSWVIFITENDYFKKNKAVYPFEMREMDDNEPLRDRRYIMYVNGEYRADNAIGHLIHDLNCSDPDDMYYPQMADRARYLKENPKGVKEMCKVMEDMRTEAALNEQVKIALAMLKDNMDYNLISKYTGLTLEQVEELAQKKSA